MSYQSEYSGAQVEEAVGKALNPDATPTEGSTNLVTSGGVYGLVSNRNLLDNWYFVGGGSQQGGGQFPINQRGQTSYTGDGYTIDRWTTRSGMVIGVAASGLTFTKSGANYVDFFQPLEQTLLDYLAGKTVTVSALTNKGLFEFGSFTWDSSGSGGGKGGDSNTIRLYAGGTTRAYTNFLLRVYDTSYVLYAVKLELGSVSTLANDVAPNFAEELAKCQRYAVVLGSDTYGIIGFGYTPNTVLARIGIHLPVTMRAVPTFSIISGTISDLIIRTTNQVAASAVQMDSYGSSSILEMLVTPSASVTAMVPCDCFLKSGAKCLLSADL